MKSAIIILAVALSVVAPISAEEAEAEARVQPKVKLFESGGYVYAYVYAGASGNKEEESAVYAISYSGLNNDETEFGKPVDVSETDYKDRFEIGRAETFGIGRTVTVTIYRVASNPEASPSALILTAASDARASDTWPKQEDYKSK
jgi:hypothetical protein